MGPKKKMQPLGTKRARNLSCQKKSRNLLGQKKIMLPLKTKKNHATSQDKKIMLSIGQITSKLVNKESDKKKQISYGILP